MFKYTLDNKRYYTLNYFFKKKFGQKVFKVPIDINSTCPNQVNGGCIYCSNKSTASISDGNLDILEQFENGKKIMEQKWPDSLYIPYFQRIHIMIKIWLNVMLISCYYYLKLWE